MMLPLRSILAALVAAPVAFSALAAQDAPVRLATTGPVMVADAARDSAIAKLEDFLTDYPNSPLRPNALFPELAVIDLLDAFIAKKQIDHISKGRSNRNS